MGSLFGGGSKPDKPTYVAPKYTQYTLPELNDTLQKFADQKEKFGGMQDAISASSSGYLDALDKLQPGYKASLLKSQQTADSLAAGNVPADVAAKITRGSAFKGLTSGMGGQQRETLEARDLALTSMDFQNMGLGMQKNNRAETLSYMPLQAMNLAFSPQGIRSEQTTVGMYNNNINNSQQDANANTANRQSDSNFAYDSKYGGSSAGGMLGGLLGGLGGAGAGYAMSGGNPMGALMGGGMGMNLGGMMGGSGGGAQGQQMGGLMQTFGGSMASMGSYGMGSGSSVGGGYGGGMFGGGGGGGGFSQQYANDFSSAGREFSMSDMFGGKP